VVVPEEVEILEQQVMVDPVEDLDMEVQLMVLQLNQLNQETPVLMDLVTQVVILALGPLHLVLLEVVALVPLVNLVTMVELELRMHLMLVTVE
tara:strand:+ start:173 stop:451 length:279 start_codon:yes stop_codon:yes gene_type:complete